MFDMIISFVNVYTIVFKCYFAQLADIIYNIINFNGENTFFFFGKNLQNHI